jgi:hypothetical protein
LLVLKKLTWYQSHCSERKVDLVVECRIFRFRGLNNSVLEGLNMTAMSTSSLRFEDMLDGASNFLPWKARVTLVLKEQDLWENVDKVLPVPSRSLQIRQHRKEDIKA